MEFPVLDDDPMDKTVLCFGSEDVKGDEIAFSVCKELVGNVEGVRFVRCDTPMDVVGYSATENLYIMDAVRGLKEVSVFGSINDFRQTKSVTAHDNDLGLMLRDLTEMRLLPDVKIIGIPIGANTSVTAEEVKKIISHL